MESKRVYRSRKDKVFAGVVGGFAEYFNVNSTILRLATVFVIVATGFVPGIITYFVAALIMPEKPAESPRAKEDTTSA